MDRREATHNGFSFNLLYSKSGMQLEDQLADFFQGLSSGDLGDLSPSQLNQLDKLQMRTIKEERNITEKMAKHQESVADSTMVGLSRAVTELMRVVVELMRNKLSWL